MRLYGCLLKNDLIRQFFQSGKETTGEVREVSRMAAHLEKQDRTISASNTEMEPLVSLEKGDMSSEQLKVIFPAKST